MGEIMSKLVDEQKVTPDTCVRLIEVLQKRIDENDEPREPYQPDDDFFICKYDFALRSNNLCFFLYMGIANLLGQVVEQSKNLPMTIHEKIRCVFNISI